MRTTKIQNPRSITAVIWLLILLTVAACGRDEGEVETAEAAPVPVVTPTAAIETITVRIWATGSVQAIRRVEPGTKILGRIDRVLVREGDRVERGQLLARLESRDLQAAVAQAEAAVAMAAAELDNARVQHQRMSELHGRGSVTDKNLEDAVAGFKVSQAAHAQAEANLAAVRVPLSYAEISSPISGWVVAKHVEAGDMAAPGAPFFALEDLSTVKVEVQVPEADVVHLSAGDAATVEILGREIEAKIDRVVPAGDPKSRTFTVQLLLDNPGGTFKSGMFARVGFAGEERQALRVPTTAVVERGQLTGLFVVDGDRAALRWIKTGRRDGGRVEVLSGLGADERYVLEPPASLTDGATVEVRP
ncbi:MAG: efflux RND transporter periplasmic adaptor subunit [Thermoanaerobaculia bacterium]